MRGGEAGGRGAPLGNCGFVREVLLRPRLLSRGPGDPAPELEKVIEVPAQAAADRGLRLVVVLDEVQHIFEYESATSWRSFHIELHPHPKRPRNKKSARFDLRRRKRPAVFMHEPTAPVAQRDQVFRPVRSSWAARYHLFRARVGPGRTSTPLQRTGTATSPVMRFTENVSPSTIQIAVSPPEKVATAVCSPTTTVSVPPVG